MIWFARWMAMCYLDVMNSENGKFYSNCLAHFEKTVYPQWLKSAKLRDDLDLEFEIILEGNADFEENPTKWDGPDFKKLYHDRSK